MAFAHRGTDPHWHTEHKLTGAQRARVPIHTARTLRHGHTRTEAHGVRAPRHMACAH